MDYPIDIECESLMEGVKAKNFCTSFDEQLDIAEQLYGYQIRFHFTQEDVEKILNAEAIYPQTIKRRVREVLLAQKWKYRYLFEK